MTRRVRYCKEYTDAVEAIRAELKTRDWMEVSIGLQLNGSIVENHHLGRIARGDVQRPQMKTFTPLYEYLFPGKPVPTRRTY